MRFFSVSLIKTCLLTVVLSTCMQCATVYKTTSYSVKDVPTAPNYQQESAWAVIPSTYTNAFQRYASQQIDTLAADVFYVYPTMNTDPKDIRWNVPISDPEQRDKVINKAVLYQASAWATTGKVYAPFYRQAHLRSFIMLDKGGEEALRLAYEDVKNAFSYYLKEYNQGRPIILVGHSQGSRHAVQLLKDFFDGTPLQEQLIAAYVPGIAVAPNSFQSIKPMNQPNEIGGFVSWNTFKKGHFPKKNPDWYDGSVTTNPITWNQEKKTTLAQHKGFLYSNGKMYSQALKVDIRDGLVWSSLPKFPLRFFMSFMKNYHAGDINLFWQDIRENALLRTQEYLQKKNR